MRKENTHENQRQQSDAAKECSFLETQPGRPQNVPWLPERVRQRPECQDRCN